MYNIGLNYEHVPVSANETGLTILETLKKFKMYGVTTLDVHVDRLLSGDDTFKNILLSGLNVGSVFFKGDFGHDENIGYALSVVDYCAENNVNQIMLLTNELLDGEDEVKYLTLLKKNLRRIVKYANNFNVKVGIENFGKELSPFSTLTKVKDILKSVKGLGLIYDSGNFLLAGENPLNCLQELLPYVQRVHLKDRTYKEIDGSPMQVSIDGKNTYTTYFGNGDCDLKSIINLSKNSFESVDFIMEFDFTKLNITNDVINSATFCFTEI